MHISPGYACVGVSFPAKLLMASWKTTGWAFRDLYVRYKSQMKSRLGSEKSGQKKRATSIWSRSLLSIENATLRENRDTGRQKGDMNQADATRSHENERQPPFVLGVAAMRWAPYRKSRALIRPKENTRFWKVHHIIRITNLRLLESRIFLDDLAHAPLVRRPVLLE
jgi:hypothetical protein